MKTMRNSHASRIAIAVMAMVVAGVVLFHSHATPRGATKQTTVVAATRGAVESRAGVAVATVGQPAISEKPGIDMAALVSRLRACVAGTDPDAQARLEQALESMLTDANAAEIIRALPQDLLGSPFAAAALRHWVQADRKGAADWAALQSGLTEPEQTSVIYGWGTTDKTGLDDYLASLPSGQWKQSAVKFAANDALAAGSPQDAINLLAQMDASPARNDLLNWSATAWAQTNSGAALQWANTLQDPNQKQAALGAVAVGLAWSDPVAAANMVADQIQPGEVLDRSATSVACVWSQSDPQAAANWVASFPAGRLQGSVLETLIQRWATQDFPAASTWVNGLPDGVVRGQASQFLAAADANLHREQSISTP